MTARAMWTNPSPLPGQNKRSRTTLWITMIANFIVSICFRFFVPQPEVKDTALAFPFGPRGQCSHHQSMWMLKTKNRLIWNVLLPASAKLQLIYFKEKVAAMSYTMQQCFSVTVLDCKYNEHFWNGNFSREKSVLFWKAEGMWLNLIKVLTAMNTSNPASNFNVKLYRFI